MKNKKQNKLYFIAVLFMLLGFIKPAAAQTNPSDLMRNCKGWKITYPTGAEVKQICGIKEANYFYLNAAKDGIVFRAPINSQNGTTTNSTYIRSELRERTADGTADIYWTTTGNHAIYVKQAITHLPMTKNHLVATQIHGNKEAGIDDAMVLRLEGAKLFLSFNGGTLRSDVIVKSNYVLGTKHEVIFDVINGKHYVYYSEDGTLLAKYNAGTAAAYLVKDGSNSYVMDLNYDETYFKVGNYTQSNAEKEGSNTGNVNNYGEVVVYDFEVNHTATKGFGGGGIIIDDVAVTGVSLTPETQSIVLGSTQQLTATISPANATNTSVSYVSSNTAVATVSTTGLVTGKAVGSATITVTTADGNKTDTAAITVVQPITGTNLALNKPITGTGTVDSSNVPAQLVDGSTDTRWAVEGFPQTATINLGAKYNLESTELVAYSDRAYKFTISVSDTENGTYTTIVDRSSNTTPGTVAAPITNLLTGASGQFIKITITGAAVYTGAWVSLTEFRTYGTAVTTTPVAVTSVAISPKTGSLTVGQTVQLTPTISPANATNQAVTYTSTDSTIATVSTTGLVTALKAGSATITVKTTDGNKTDTSVITVTAATATPTLINTGINNSPVSVTTNSEQTSGNYTNYAINVLDKDLTKKWADNQNTGVLTFDFKQIFNLASIKIAAPASSTKIYNYGIQYSTDGVNYSAVTNVTSNGDTTYKEFTFSNPQARYVKITGNGSTGTSGSAYSSINEIEFYGVLATTLGTDSNTTQEDTFTLWPNPANDTVNISGANDFDTVTVYDALGRLVINQAIKGTSVDVSSLKSGVYFFTLSNKTKSVTKRIIKK